MKPVVGMVIRNKMQKSVVVAVDRLFYHKVYNRYVTRTSKFMAHDEQNRCNLGDRVLQNLSAHGPRGRKCLNSRFKHGRGETIVNFGILLERW
ncbi:30S ribosomal S17-like [Olea europaea subsp. europaea]|uniref:30S ribosomal S17-like n=1 Tax=Olea europaea subsp. europaea TaxID=158383 RepID=A0A8S0TJT7_OLEEU|nr:30S ribosomal S17-like [Olea europaea subsp. europaea]